MPVPNALTRIIDKDGEARAFSLSRIHEAISKAIQDVENVSGWESKERALKYAELVRDKIFLNFYDLGYLVQFFSKVMLAFDAKEIEERISRPQFGQRLISLIYVHILFQLQNEKLNESRRDQVASFINQRFSVYIKEASILKQVTDIFVERVYAKHAMGMTLHDQYPTWDFILDIIEMVLKDIGEINIAEGFMIYREGRKKVKIGEISEAQFTHDGVHRDRVRQTLLWNIENECDSVFALNDWVIGKDGKDFKELMRRSDERFYNDIAQVVKRITLRADEVKLVIIAGPSCSNKTTTTAIFEKELAKSGLRLRQLNVDDYFFDLAEHPKDEFGDYDFEMPEAIDMKLLNENLRDLIQGKTIKKPKYNFKTGLREKYVDFQVAKDEVILIDCLHGLYSKLTESVPAEKKFKIYTESSNMLRATDGNYTKWTDVRLSKRMLRDSIYRSYDVLKTLGHWVYVRKGELKHIIPYIYSVDAVLNAGLPYELPILKHYLQSKLPNQEYLTKLRLDGRLDAYIRGVRQNTLFETIIAYDKVDEVSAYSPLREFIGGSAYQLAHNE